MGAVYDMCRTDPCNFSLFFLLSIGFIISMCGLSQIPVGNIGFEIESVAITQNVTWPTGSSEWRGEKIIVEYVNGVATREFVKGEDHHLHPRSLTRNWGDYMPGLRITAPSNFYLPEYAWKVVPEEVPLLWTGPIWCFVSGATVMMGSYFKSRNVLLVAIVMVNVSASLLLISSHRIVELTHFCSECDSQTKYISEDGQSLGSLPDSTEDPDVFADNNCPPIHSNCEEGRNAYLAGGVINLICMYLMFIAIEMRRCRISAKQPLASQDSAGAP